MNNKHQKKFSCWTLSFVLIVVILTSCGNPKNNKQEKDIFTKSFNLPKIPPMLTSPEQRAEYSVSRYWDNFNFADTTLITKPEITEQAFVDFINHLNYVSGDVSSKAINKMLNSANNYDGAMFNYFVELYEKYLHEPNSPFRNEDIYIEVLKHIISSPKVDDANKIRPNYQLKIAMKNRVNDIANDFEFKLKNNSTSTLHKLTADYTIIFFNNPDCGECARVKVLIESSNEISSLLDAKKLVVLSVYPDEDLAAWMKQKYPSNWINGYDAEQIITDNELYELQAIPTLYLLDKDKKVIAKDATIEYIVDLLNKNK